MPSGEISLRNFNRLRVSRLWRWRHGVREKIIARMATGNQHVNFEAGEWPIYVVTLPRQPLSHMEHQAMVDRITRETYGRREPFVLIYDGSLQLQRPDAMQRQTLARALQEGEKLCPDRLRGLAVIVPSLDERGAITAISWLAQPRCPVQTFTMLLRAKEWAREILGRARADAGTGAMVQPKSARTHAEKG